MERKGINCYMRKDLIDIIMNSIDSGALDIRECLRRPEKHKNTRGNDLFGYSPANLAKASLYYSHYCKKFSFNTAEEIFVQMKVSLAIEELIFIFNKALFSNIHCVDFLNDMMDIEEIIVELYSRFSNKPQKEIQAVLNKKMEIYTNNWNEFVKDEDNVTLEQLGTFYNSIPFPAACYLNDCAKDSLSTAYRALPILLARSNKSKRIFDFGGNSGMITSALANSIDIDYCMLIEENETLLEFAKWRDELFGIKHVLYNRESYISENIDQFRGQFDLGICTEVLEHVYDVEETVSNISKLLQTGGLLYQTTSFGLYPEPSHLKKNIVYAGHEDELMAKYGLERIDIQFPIPLLPTIKVYIKR